MLSINAKNTYSKFLVLKIITNLFDLIGTLLLGALVGLIVRILENPESNAGIPFFNNIEFFANLDSRNRVIIFSAMVLIIFLVRPIIILPLTKKYGKIIQIEGAILADLLLSKYSVLTISTIRKWSTSELTYSITSGLTNVMNLIWMSVLLLTDISLLIMFLFILMMSDIYLTIILGIYMFILYFTLYWINNNRMVQAGESLARSSTKSMTLVNDFISLFRELTLSSNVKFVLNDFRDAREQQGLSNAMVEWLDSIPRYVIDIALILGLVLVAFSQMDQSSLESAASKTALFVISALRILPTIGPIQNTYSRIGNLIAATGPLFDFRKDLDIEFLKRKGYLDKKNLAYKDINFDLTKGITVSNLNFSYNRSNLNKLEINEINFNIMFGQSVAIIGKSGAGKTTLVDLLLGLLEPINGNIEIGGICPELAVRKDKNLIRYVSQDINLINASILHNIELGTSSSDMENSRLRDVIKYSNLTEFIEKLPQGLETVVGERGTRISGGQRQRIGIARALYSNPKILVLDEATSALDAETEAAITGMLKELHGQVTIISIAHRLSTVMHSDLVLFLRDGKLAGSGKFEDLVKQHPDLAHQAELLGIDIDQNQ